MSASYLGLVRRRSARRLLYALSAACVSYGMLTLTILITIERATGSYRDGGFAVAAFTAASGLSAPLRGRLVDRYGGRRWLPILACGYASALVALVVVAHGGGSSVSLVGLAGAVGASTPPLFASARAVWPQAVEPRFLRHAYALMSLLLDAGQVGGPVLAGLLFLVSGWLPPLLCAAAGLAAAILSLPTRDPSRYSHEPRPMPRLSRSRALQGLLGVSVLLGASQGLVQVAVPTVAGRWHHASLAGPLLAAFALGSVLGGLWFGSRRWHLAVIDRYLRAALAGGLLLAPVALAGGVFSLAPLLFAAGLAYGPATVSMFETLDVVAPAAGAEALTWVTTAEASGSGAGAALAGVLASGAGRELPFLLASAVLLVPGALALAARRRARPA